MKKVLIFVLAVAALLGGSYLYRTTLRSSEFVIISTNDVHGSLGDMSRLATAVKESRDTVFTLVVDAGDRWTGNAYIDLAEGRLPIIHLMNAVTQVWRRLTVLCVVPTSTLFAPTWRVKKSCSPKLQIASA